MRAFQSIRWRLQFWHGLLLALVLGGFGITLWELFRGQQLRRSDQELEERLGVIIRSVEHEGGVRGRPPREQPLPDQRPPPRDPRWERDRPPPPPGQPEPAPFDGPPPRRDLRLGARELSLFDGTGEHAFYYVAWLPEGEELSRSASAPREVPYPDRGALPRGSHLRGTMREVFHFPPPGGCFLVGRDISDTLAEIHRFAWLTGSAGLVILALGLAGGWWISTRALRPIADISAAAAKISTGDLSQRIRTADSGSELAKLAQVLNDTFARLQASFARQAQFTADASHELRTPVTVLLTETQAALARERPPAEYRESLAACQRAAQRMRRLTESLLMLARLDSGETGPAREPCEFDRIAAEAADLLRPLAAERNVEIAVEPPEAPVCCLGDPEQIGQVVSNLVSNAIYYNQPGGKVHVKVCAGPGSAVLTVSDTGQGIAPEDLPHLFERFYRADKARSSAPGRTGLGLAITKAIVESHAGTIEVSSDPGHGSSFEVRLPAAAPAATASRESASG